MFIFWRLFWPFLRLDYDRWRVFFLQCIRTLKYLLVGQTFVVVRRTRVIVYPLRLTHLLHVSVLHFFFSNHLFVILQQLMSFVLLANSWRLTRSITGVVPSRLLSALHSSLIKKLVLSHYIILIGKHGSHRSLRKISRLRHQVVLRLVIASRCSSRIRLPLNVGSRHLRHHVSSLAFAGIHVALWLTLVLMHYDVIILLGSVGLLIL